MSEVQDNTSSGAPADQPPAAGTTETVDINANLVSGITVGVCALAAVLLWWLMGGWSLLVDVLGAVVVGVALYGVGLVAAEHEQAQRQDAGAGSSRPAGAAGSPSPLARGIAGAVVPVLVGGICVTLAAAHHSSTDDVCRAWSDYRSQEQTSMASTAVFDSDYFDAVKHLGSTAADFGDDSSGVVSAGKRLQQMADGNGDTIVTIDLGQVDQVAAPITGMCE